MTHTDAQQIQLGKIAAAHGLQGHLLWVHDQVQKQALGYIKVFFIEMSLGNTVPFFIELIENKDNTSSYVKTEEVNNRDAALKLVGKKVWLQEADFQQIIPKHSPARWVGFEVFDANQCIGTVLYITEMPHQVLLAVDWQGKEVLLPVHEASLQKIDVKKKQIYLKLPEGLLDIYN